MADNYLEKQMDDYRRGARTIVRQAGTANNSVFILGDDHEIIRFWVKRFRCFGWRTAFADANLTRGRDLAQSTGSQHHPIELNRCSIERSLDLILERWQKIDLIIIAGKVNATQMIEEIGAERRIPILSSLE